MSQQQQFGGNNAPRERVARFQVKEGIFSRYTGANEPAENFQWLNGRLHGITIRDFEKDNVTLTFCDFHFQLDDGQKFVVSTIASSSITADIVGRLANVKDLKNVLVLSAWLNGNFTNVSIKEKPSFETSNDQAEKVPFTQMPKVVVTKVGFSKSVDSSERDDLVIKLIGEINDKLRALGVDVPADASSSASAQPAQGAGQEAGQAAAEQAAPAAQAPEAPEAKQDGEDMPAGDAGSGYTPQTDVY